MEIISVIQDWSDLVDECILGYNNSIFELDYDLQIRSDIENFLRENDEFVKTNDLFSRIKEIDLKFLDLLVFLDENTEKFFWNRKFILKYGSSMYAESVYSNFKIQVKIV